MSEENNKLIAIFEDHPVRRAWVEKEEKWYFSVVDIIAILTDSIDPRKYWNKLSQRLRDEGSEVVTKCHQLKMMASDGKKYLTDAADVETVFRLVQSIPSPKAEPFKLWLARVGYERMQETVDPELTIARGRKTMLFGSFFFCHPRAPSGIQSILGERLTKRDWIPASAGMTEWSISPCPF